RFSTYASHWICQAIARAIDDQYRTIRVPAYAGQLLRRAARRYEELMRELGREPDDDELAGDLGVNIDRVREIAAIARPILSLDNPLQDGDETAVVGDFVEDREGDSPFEHVHRSMVHEELQRALENLTPREQNIIRSRFGLDDEQGQTLSQLGAEMKMTRERVRQIEKRALKKLRLALGPMMEV
ncbi:MAG: sigma-70 family RNA polymerase sigma factor, partial [Armatimonadota bacterium]|nr:sigma-70 family RNA polymerase sigma factor [Armatimonadota bacterium]